MRAPRLTVRQKVFGLVGINFLALGVVLAFTLSHTYTSLMEERELTIQSVVDSAHSVLAHLEQQVASGRLSSDEARRQAIATIKAMRYRGAEYLWINDMQPRMLMHPTRPELDGQGLSDYKDPDGKRLFVEFVEAVKRSGQGFVHYRWPKPGSDQPVPKVSYVKGFAAWGWVVGSGIYLDDVSATFWRSAVWYSAVISLVGLLCVAFGALIAGRIARPLRQAVDVLQAIAAGDFTRRLDVTSRDEVGQMAGALNEAAERMKGALREMRAAAEHTATASRQLSEGSEELSSGAQEQAASLEETAASLEEITGTVKQNADNAEQANELAAASRETAEKGGLVVTDAVAAMAEINRASKKIADIITTIDEIAFQTNLLALNAAVEAARAGEQGRGFAVVAAEVRNLAQRSATAAKEIKGLIEDSVAKVDAGSELVTRSGQTLEEIVSSVKRVTHIIAEIAAASREQTAGIDQVNVAVTQMDQVTQANAAQTEELSATSHALAAQADQLQALVSRFKLDAGVAARQAGAGPSPAVGTIGASPTKAIAARTRPDAAGPARVVAHANAHAPNGNGSARAVAGGFEEF
jgi:methyl-accepting chemotaxis protein